MNNRYALPHNSRQTVQQYCNGKGQSTSQLDDAVLYSTVQYRTIISGQIPDMAQLACERWWASLSSYLRPSPT